MTVTMASAPVVLLSNQSPIPRQNRVRRYVRQNAATELLTVSSQTTASLVGPYQFAIVLASEFRAATAHSSATVRYRPTASTPMT